MRIRLMYWLAVVIALCAAAAVRWIDPEPLARLRLVAFDTLQELGEAIRDSRRLSLDYGQINQELDLKADNAAMRPIDPSVVPNPYIPPLETNPQRTRREEQQDATRKEKEAEDKANDKKHR